MPADVPARRPRLSIWKRLSRWPVLEQLRRRADGTGPESMSPRTRSLHAKTRGAQSTPSICPYCAVGCGQQVFHAEGRLIAIEGDPESPLSRGTLCPRGAASAGLLTHPRRLKTVLYRAPRARAWTELPLSEAMDRVAHRVWESRRNTFKLEEDGVPLFHTTGLAHLGGATLGNEENYLIRKLFTAGLGIVGMSNQGRL